MKKLIILFLAIFFSGCEEEYIQNGIKYTSQSLYNSIVNNINEENIIRIKNEICHGNLNIIPLSKEQLRNINLTITEMHIKIHQIDPNFRSEYLDKNYNEEVNKKIDNMVYSTASTSGNVTISGIFIAAAGALYDEYTNEQILSNPKVKEIIPPYEKKVEELIKKYGRENIGSCDIKITDFELGNWDEHWQLIKKAGGYDGKFRDSEFKISINNIYKLNLDYSDFDNKKFTYNITLE